MARTTEPHLRDGTRPEGHDEVESKGPCPRCGSKDNLVTYRDGHAHCYTPGCGYFIKAEGSEPTTHRSRPMIPDSLLTPGPGDWTHLSKRKLQADTLRRFGYFAPGYSGKKVQAAPYYDQGGQLVAQKLRFPDKTFTVLKAEGYTTLHDCQLFGQHLWSGKDRRVVVTEGELDAMTVAQCTDFKTPSVSIPSGAEGALKALQKNLLWLMGFDEVILWFDDDEPGKKAVAECVRLFSPGRVKVARVDGFKDASDVLQAGRPGDVVAAIFSAAPWSPPGILSARDVLKRVDFDAPAPKRFALPWPGLTKMLYGGLEREGVVFLLSGTGLGKTTFLCETIDAMLFGDEKLTVGAILFEDSLEDVVDGLLTVRTSRRLRLDPKLVAADVKREEWKHIADTDRLFLFDGENAQWGLKNLLEYVRYLVKGCGCNYVFIDPLSFLVAQSDLPDERKAIDNVVVELAALTKQLHFGVLVTHHLTRPEGEKGHEEGAAVYLKQARGSNGIGQFASLALGLRWHPDTELTSVVCLKARKQGELKGKTLAWLQYQPATGRVVEVDGPTEGGSTKATAALSNQDY